MSRNFVSYFWTKVEAEYRKICAEHMAVLPVSVGRIAHDLQLEVVSATLKSGVSGMIMPNDKPEFRYLIKVNRHENKFRQRFTVAHEIGHALLHESLIGEGIVDSVLYRSRVSDNIEAQANQIAADILMPRQSLSDYLRMYYPNGVSEMDVAEISRHLKVSKVALKIRLGK